MPPQGRDDIVFYSFTILLIATIVAVFSLLPSERRFLIGLRREKTGYVVIDGLAGDED